MEASGGTRVAKLGRRAFLRSAATIAGRTAMIASLVAGFGLWRRRDTEPPAGARGRLGVLRPPGALGEEAFAAFCIRCTRCADACDTQCIRFFGPGAGFQAGTPYIDANGRGCNLCLACGEACPTGAIQPLAASTDVAMGVAAVDERLCVSHNGTGVCGACYTICPLKGAAITQNHRNAPVVHDDACVGCGLCEEICIVRDRRAIQVVSDRRWWGSDGARQRRAS